MSSLFSYFARLLSNLACPNLPSSPLFVSTSHSQLNVFPISLLLASCCHRESIIIKYQKYQNTNHSSKSEDSTPSLASTKGLYGWKSRWCLRRVVETISSLHSGDTCAFLGKKGELSPARREIATSHRYRKDAGVRNYAAVAVKRPLVENHRRQWGLRRE